MAGKVAGDHNSMRTFEKHNYITTLDFEMIMQMCPDHYRHYLDIIFTKFAVPINLRSGSK